MVSYDPSNWFKALAFHRADTFRKLWPWLIAIGVFTWIVGFVELERMGLGDESLVKNLPVMHSLLGFAISMLLVFRTNTAYDRWWEGRKLWGGLVNVSRNLALRIGVYLRPEDQEGRALFARLIGLFAHELRDHLLRERTRLELDAAPHPELPSIDREKHVPAQVVNAMHMRIQRLFHERAITGEQLIVLSNDVNAFLDICGACERIKNTPIPYSYSSFIKKFIVLYAITLPMGFAFTLGWWAVPVVMFIFYVLTSLELIAEEIEDPFSGDENDIPMMRIADTIERNVKEILD